VGRTSLSLFDFSWWRAEVASLPLLRKSLPPTLDCSIHGYSVNNARAACTARHC
jgi:hypothetical protein